MNERLKQKNILAILELIFKISYLVLAISTFNSLLFGKPIMSILVEITFILGCILILERIVHWKEYRGMPYLIWLILFIVSFGISSLVNIQYGFIENIKWIIWTTFQMFLLYVKKQDGNIQNYQKEFSILSKIIIGYSFFASVVSFVLLFMGYSKTWISETTGQRMIMGFVWGRLWGIYTDPNYGAVISVISIILSLYFIYKSRNKVWIFYIANIVCQFIYIVFSDSRTGKVTLIVSIGFYVYCMLLRNVKITIGKISNMFLTCLVCVLMIGGMQGIKNIYNELIELQSEETDVMETVQEIGREEDIKEDISNRRFSIWRSGWEILETAPVFGTGYVTCIPYVMENLPDTYLVNNDYAVFGSMHNGFLNVLVYQGVVGFIIFMIFTIGIVVKVMSGIWQLQSEEYCYGIVLASCIGAVTCSMMFLLEGTYTNSIGSIVLWNSLGYLVQMISLEHKRNYQKQEEK